MSRTGRNGAAPAAGRADRLITRLVEARGFDEYAPLARELAQISESELGSADGHTSGRYEGRVLDVAAMLAAPDEPIPWRCESLTADGYLTVLAGAGGEGKSWLALSLACGVARGGVAAGIGCEEGRAVIFDAENGPKLIARRFRAAGVTAQLDVQPIYADGLHIRKDLDWFRSVIVERKASLAVFDSLRVLSTGAKESDSDEMEPLITALKQLARETQAAILLIHHRGKSELSEYRGSSVIRDQTDMLFTLGRVPHDPEARTRRKITTIKCRIDEEPAPRWVRLEADPAIGGVYVNEAEPFEEEEGAAKPRDQYRDQALDALNDTPRSERSLVESSGIPRTTLQRLLADFEREGLAEKRPDGWVAHRPTALGGGPGGPPPENGSTERDQGGPGSGPAGQLWATPADVGLGPACSCAEPGEPALDGRCSRCWGWPKGASA